MQHEDSITRWINEVRDGNQQAVQELWHRYFDRLVRLARHKLSDANKRVSDEEDIALSVFERFRTAAQQGRLPDLNDRDSLWRLLAKITADKSVDLQRRENRVRRGGGNVRGESALGENASGDPTPETLAILSEQINRFLDGIGRDDLKEIALMKMEGYYNYEIAKTLGCSERTIERRLKLIKARLEQEI